MTVVEALSYPWLNPLFTLGPSFYQADSLLCLGSNARIFHLGQMACLQSLRERGFCGQVLIHYFNHSPGSSLSAPLQRRPLSRLRSPLMPGWLTAFLVSLIPIFPSSKMPENFCYPKRKLCCFSSMVTNIFSLFI